MLKDRSWLWVLRLSFAVLLGAVAYALPACGGGDGDVSCEERSLRWSFAGSTGVQECEFLCGRCFSGTFEAATCEEQSGRASCRCAGAGTMTVCPDDPGLTKGCRTSACP